jgi:phosphatidate cytidylyltransferase
MKIDLLAILVFFSALLGTVGTAIANLKKDRKIRQRRWLKAGVFFIIVVGITLCILLSRRSLIFLAAIISTAGFIELWYVRHSSKSFRLPPLTYLNIFLFFGWISVSFLMMILYFSPDLTLLIFFTVFSFDAFSQVSGQLFGRHHLFPKTSPGKTYEGLLGGVIAALITCYILTKALQIPLGALKSIIMGTIISATSLCGDYLASKYKRLHRVKDFSRLLPGQGGFLDRFDSWLFSGAILYWLKKILEIL